MSNGNGKQNLVKPHILLIGLVLVAFNSYWLPDGDRGLALHAVNDRLAVL